MRAIRVSLCLALLGTVAGASGAEPRRPSPPPPPPAQEESRPRAPDSGTNAFEPEVTITSKGTEIHEEYRHNGQLYMVKVIPSRGPPYYLIYDERGNTRRSDVEPDIVAPSWVIKRF